MRLAGASVVVVDENLAFSENVAEMLRAEGACVEVVSTAEDALLKARGNEYDVALVEVLLRDMSGAQLMTRLSALCPHLEVLLLSGNARLEEAARGVALGAYQYLLKPLDPATLVMEVTRAHRQARSSKEIEALRGELERSDSGLSTLVSTVHTLLLVLDERGRVAMANDAAAEAAGVLASALVGSDWFGEYVHQDDRQAALRGLGDLFALQRTQTWQSRVARHDSEGRVDYRWVRWRAALHRNPQGISRVYLSGLDLSDTRELERRARLTEKLAAVGTLSAGLAHEIRNPLNAAGLQLRLLNRRLEAKKADALLTEPVALVQAELGRLSRLVGEFLHFARPTGLVRSRVDVGALVQSVVDLEAPAAIERGARITALLPPAPAVVEGDAEKLRQVVLNLLRNAVEASGRGAGVEVAVDMDSRGASIRVSDEGEGIPNQHLPRIFEPFYSTKPGGTGLGMSIVHSLVTLHGGDVSVDSQEGGGTAVTVSLPIVAP